MSDQASERLLDVMSLEQVTKIFVDVNQRQEAARIEHRRRHEEIEARRRRPMSTTIDGLEAQIAAALAASRHTQDAALAERRREKELAAVQAEASAARRRNTRIGG